MDGFSVDWSTVLKFVQALAAPIAAIVVARMAVTSFRRQKSIERRLDWYERMHRSIGRTGVAISLIESSAAVDRSASIAVANEAVRELATLSNDAWTYADAAGFQATRALTSELAKVLTLPESRELSLQAVREIEIACFRAANVLAEELRAELLLKRLPQDTRSVESLPPAA